MLKNLIFRVIFVALLGFTGMGTPAKAQAASGLDYVCIISSYEYQNEWGQILAKKLKKEVEGSLHAQNIEIFYTGISNADSLGIARELLKTEEWMAKSPSLVIVIGYEAWMTLRSTDDARLKEIPMILCGVQEQEYADYDHFLRNKRIADFRNLVPVDSLLTGYNALAVTQQNNAKKTMKEIAGLLPQKRDIVFVSGQNYSDIRYAQCLDEVINASYPSLRLLTQKVSKVNNQALGGLKSKIDEERTVIILNHYNAPENPDQKDFSDLPDVPVFLLCDKELYSTSGFVGGVYEPVPIYSNRIVSGIKDLLSGKKQTDKPHEKALRSTINKSAAQKFNINLKNLSDLLVVAEPQVNKNQYLFAFIGFVLLPLLFIIGVILLIIMIFRKNRSAGKIEEYSSAVTKFQTIYRNIPVGIGAFHEDGSYREWNQEFLKMARLLLPDFKPSNRFNLFTSELISEEINEAINKREVGERILTTEQNGVQTRARIIFTPIREKSSGIIVSIFDVTQTMEENEKRNLLGSIFDKAMGESRLGIAELDFIKGRCTATDGWYKGLNVVKNTTLDLCFANLHPQDKPLLVAFMDELEQSKTGDTLTLEIRIQQLDTTYNWVKLTFNIKERDEESRKTICSVVLADIHTHKQREEQLKEACNRIISGNRIKNSFLSNMNNDIRMPLNAIVGFSELIIESTDSAEQKELVKYLNENNEKFLKLVSDIVDMSQIAAGTLKCRMSDVDINEMMNELIANIQPSLNNPQVQLIFHPQEHCVVYSDRDKLLQVMTNFLNNALKATQRGSIELGYKILSKKIQLYVKDTGCGVEPEKREHLFDRFSKKTNEYTGAGTGLSISSAIIKLLKGEIGFDTELDKGSNFWCTIPSEYVGTDIQIGLTGKLDSATKLMDTSLKTILIAEDNTNNFQLLNFILKGKFKILHAINGEKAVEMFKQYGPDIILMDIKMPIMDGYQATAAIREISKEVPIIAVTAYAFNNDKEKILDSSFTGFIAKPVREKELLETINDILNK